MATHPPDEALLNRLLAALPSEEYERYRNHLEPVDFTRGQLIYEPAERITDVYFVTKGAASLLMTDKLGSSVAVALIGNEGVLGLPAALGVHVTPFTVLMVTPGRGMRVKPEFARNMLGGGGPLQQPILRYLCTLFAQIAQTALCNRFHSVEQRVCRWLLVTADFAGCAERIEVTQEFLSWMLGAGRPAINAALNLLKNTGTIFTARSCITVASYDELKSHCCECREVIKAAYACASGAKNR